MDKLKPILAAMKKHHFWVVCGVVVVTALALWWIASSALAGRYGERKEKLLGLEKAVTDLGQKSQPPNDKVAAMAQECNKLLADKVNAAWRLRYDEQQKKNPWPEAELGAEFVMVVKSLQPSDEIPVLYREVYQHFIKKYFPTLFQIIDLRREVPKLRRPLAKDQTKAGGAAESTASAAAGDDLMRILAGAGAGTMPGSMTSDSASGMYAAPGMSYSDASGGPARTDVETVGKVEWDRADIVRIVSRYMWPQAPTTQQLRLAQEDLWVYKALLEIIRNTNGGASFRDLPIKRILALQIGRDAAAAFVSAGNRIVGMGTGTSGGTPGMERSMAGYGSSMMGSSGMMGPPPGMGSAETPGMTGGTTGASTLSPAERLARELTEFRYVDQKGKPLAADAKPPFEEFKMMPVFMRLIIDQQKIPNLLAECANSTMPVEVHQVSYRPGQGQRVNLAIGAAGGTSGSMAPGMSGSGMYAGAMGGSYPSPMGSTSETAPGMGGYPMGTGGQAGSQDLTSSEHVPIEVLGIIYIFNNPSDTKKSASGEVAPSPVAQPVAAPAPAPVAAPTTIPAGTPAATPAPAPAPTPAPATPPPTVPAAPQGTGT